MGRGVLFFSLAGWNSVCDCLCCFIANHVPSIESVSEIGIEPGTARLRIRGASDPQWVKFILQELLR